MSAINANGMGGGRSSATMGQRQSPAFLPWALFGFAWCALIVYMAIGWFTGPDFAPITPVGPDVPPRWMYITAQIIEIISAAASLFVVYKYLIKPWRQTGSITPDGLLMLACMTMYVQDFWCNYFGYFCQLSPVFHSWGSWANYVPGWLTPNQGRLPEAPLAWGLCYGSWFVLLPMIYGAKFMGWLHSKRPRMSGMELFAVSTLFFTVLWFMIESIFLRTGMYVYGLSIQSLSLWPGETYQYPIYEFVAWGICYGLFAAAYYYKDDKGYMFIEKGIDRLKASNGQKKALRFFAMTGLVNIIFLSLWSIPMSVSTLWADPMPKSMPSYLIAGLCGPTTNYDCHTPGTPLATRSTLTNRTVSADKLPVSPTQQAVLNRHPY